MMTIYEKGDIIRNPRNGERCVILSYPDPREANKTYAVFCGMGYITTMSRAQLDVIYPEYVGRDFAYVSQAEDNMTRHFKN